MLCEKCGKNEANVYIKNTVNGETTEKHLCSVCAGEQGMLKPGGFFDMPDFFKDFAGAFSGFFPVAHAPARRSVGAGTACPVCGANAGDISRAGRVGCADCYSVFVAALEPARRRIHGGASHTGNIPGSAGAEATLKKRLAELKHEMKAAIENEEFENAAKLRDEIRGLEKGGESA
jgi:protein arginine kinase activator